MNKYHLNITINTKYHNAGTKANIDCKKILLQHGFIDLEIGFFKTVYLLPFNLAKLFYHLIKYSLQIPAGSLVITQYPLLGINKYFGWYSRLLRKKKCKVGCIIHDLDSLRAKPNFTIRNEVRALSAYDVIITHNPKMSRLLQQNGYKGKMVNIMLFDFLTKYTPGKAIGVDKKPAIIFAGSLGRCGFLKNINKINNLEFNLYGPGLPADVINYPNVNYQGSFPVEDIIYNIQGTYGLIWDGPSIYECTGTMGNYLQVNTPHKLSLYLSAGIPVILPDTAAMAPFVKEQGIGLVIDNLIKLPAAISGVSDVHYLEMKQNALKTGVLLKQGVYFTNAITSVEKALQYVEG